MKILLYLFFGGISIATFSGCVRAIKYESLKKQYDESEEARIKALNRADSLAKDHDKLSARNQDLQKELTRLKDDFASIDSLYRRNKRLSDDVFSKYERLEKQYNQLLSNGDAEAGRLSGDLAKREKELYALEQRIQASKAENDKLAADLQDRELRVMQLEKIIADKERMAKDLKNKVANALLGFNSTELTIENKNGKVYVSLAEKLLFQSGSFAVDSRGAEALKKLAVVLKSQSDISIQVEGHTDDVPMASGTVGMKDNWDLSVLRATSITRILTSAGLQPEKILASGKAQYEPLIAEKTPDARRKNRRTEIILTPKLEELYKILGN